MEKAHQHDTAHNYDVIVIGGGPSGMMAAGTAGARGLRVLLIEKNKRLGEKLRITGGGRCNVTNEESDLRTILKRYGPAEQFLYSPFTQFGTPDTFTFFKERGLPLVVEAAGRAFPHTHDATDVERAMEQYCKAGNVTILTSTPVEAITTTANASGTNTTTGVTAKGISYTAKNIIIATGGTSHPETGSTGDGFTWLANLGHTIKKPTPSLVPLSVPDAWVQNLAGVTLPEMKVTFFVSKNSETADGAPMNSAPTKAFSKTGRLLFTHFGLSGPLILNAAKNIADLLYEGPVTGAIDLFPKKDFSVVEQEILGIFDANKNKTFKNVCKEFVPAGMPGAIVDLITQTIGDTVAETKVHSVSKEDRKAIIHLLKALPFSVEGLMGYDRAVVADGGVAIDEIDMRTMRSKKHPNLHVTGDLLNINRPTGGFSLQLCWTTGYVAGMHVDND